MENFSKISILDYPHSLEENSRFRARLLKACEVDIILQKEVKELCRRNILLWIDLFCWTKDPRKQPDVLPFICYETYQKEYILEIEKAINEQSDELTDKSRDMGVSWMILYVFSHKWLFEDGSDFRVGSRKEDFVDKLNDIDTLLEKVRFNLKKQPHWLLPKNFNPMEHAGYMRIHNPNNGNMIIGESANPHFGSGGRRKAILLDEFAKWEDSIAEAAWTACYSKDTEALTSTGWKFIKDITFNDLVYSMDIETREARYMPVTELHKYYFDELIHFKGKAIDLMVTENHNMMYELKQSRKIIYKSAKHCYNLARSASQASVPLVSDYIDGAFPQMIYGYDAGDWMEFLGWYISEGCVKKGSGGICISQSQHYNPENVEKIKGLLERMGCKYRYNRGKSFYIHARRFNKLAIEELKELGKSHMKYIPREYLNMNQSLLERLWESLLLGDGYCRTRLGREKKQTGYTTVSRQLADDVQELIQKIGLKATILIREQKPLHIMNRPKLTIPRIGYNVSVGYKKRSGYGQMKREYVSYRDFVYCVTTKYHSLYVRRNNKAVWCGNTADVTKCRLPISTPVGSGNKFAQLATGTKEKIKKVTLHWTLHPEKSKGVYYLDANGTKIPITDSQRAFEMWKRGIKVRSPWYDAEAERRSEADLAQEVDIDYLRSGHPFFSLTALSKQKSWQFIQRRLPSDPIPYGRFIRVKLVDVDNKIELRELPNEWLRIFELPKPDYQYVVGADTSEGLAKGDESFLTVREKTTRNVVACANGLFKPDDFAVKLTRVGIFYNRANVAPENANHGYAVCDYLKKADCNLYWTKHIDAKGKTTIVKAGWTTDSRSRPNMLDQLEQEIRKNVIELRDPILISQAKTFVKNPKTGKAEADGSFLDDGIIACAIGGIVIKEIPYKAKPNTNRKFAQLYDDLKKPVGSFKK